LGRRDRLSRSHLMELLRARGRRFSEKGPNLR